MLDWRISITTNGLLWCIIYALGLYILYYLYDLLWATPTNFQAYFKKQGMDGRKYRFLLGQLPEVHKAAEADKIVEYGVDTHKQFGLVQTQCTGFIPYISCCDPAILRLIFTSKANCYHKARHEDKDMWRSLLKNGLLLSEDDVWKTHRSLLNNAFHFHYLQDLIPILNDCVTSYIKKVNDGIASGTTGSVRFDMSHDLAAITLDSVATSAFGSVFHDDPQRADLFIKSLKHVLDGIQARCLNLTGYIPFIKHLPLPNKKKVDENCKILDDIVHDIIRQRKEGEIHSINERRDLMTMMLEANLSDKEIHEESVTFIAAGAETTSNLAVWLLYRMCQEEGVMEKVREEVDRVLSNEDGSDIDHVLDLNRLKDLKYLEATIYEALRLHPPATIIPKYCIKDHELGPYFIPKGTTITINVIVVQRLEKYWPEPEKFKPERFLTQKDLKEEKEELAQLNNDDDATSGNSTTAAGKTKLTKEEKEKRAAQPFSFLAFSAGPRKCIGKNLAMLELKMIFSLLLRQFNFRLDTEQKIFSDPVTRLPKYGMYFHLSKRDPTLRKQQEVEARRKYEQQQAEEAATAATEAEQQTEDEEHSAAASTVKARVLKPIGMI